jgi:hypothetical protein
MLQDNYPLFVVAATTAVAYLVGRRVFDRPKIRFADALRKCMECIGAFVVFLSVNVGLGLAVIFVARMITAHFISVYSTVANPSLVILSAVQGISFRLWWSD